MFLFFPFFRELLSNGSLHFTHIIHSSTDRPDEGVYQCVATVNDLGSIVSRKAKLQIACEYCSWTLPLIDVTHVILQ